MNFRTYLAWVSLVAVVAVVTSQPGTGGGTAQPSAPPVNAIDPCLSYAGCGTCVADTRCVWCLSATSLPCRSKANCPMTGYTDCCVLLKTCDACRSSATCGYCGDTKLCIPGNVTRPRQTTCAGWYFDKCPDASKNPNLNVILVIMLTIGSGVVLLSVVLLILFIRRIIRQNKARKDMNEYYQPSRSMCDFCQDGLATVFCKQCKLSLCDHCKESDDLHPPGVTHTLQPIEFNVQEDREHLRQEDVYTSFAGLLPKSGSNSFRSYGSQGQ